MNPSVATKEKVEGIFKKRTGIDIEQAPGHPTILVATINPEIGSGLKELFQAFPLNTIWVKGVEASKTMLAKKRIAACLCGFWLQDGTYRELVRHIRRENMEIPVIIVSEPNCPPEYGDYLAAMNIGALNFLCHPYRKSDLEEMLRLAIGGAHTRSVRQPASIVGPDLHPRRAA
jgi:DNA-binding NtrC family response regulator